MIYSCKNVEKLISVDFPSYLDNKAQESKDVVIEADLTIMFQAELRMKMSVKARKGRLKVIIMEYCSLFRTNGIKWVIEKTSKLAIRHVLSAVRPMQLCSRVEQDLAFAYHHLKADFDGFNGTCRAGLRSL